MELHSDRSGGLPAPVDLTAAKRKKSWVRRFLRWFLYSVGGLILFVVLYVAAGWILGKVPANGSFQQTPGGIEIAVLNNGVHCDIAVPMENDQFSWRGFLGGTHPTAHLEQYQYVLIGWGNRRFYLETRTWDDFKVSTAVAALTGVGETVVHVDSLTKLPTSKAYCRRIRISADQYRVLCESLTSSFATGADDSVVKIPDAAYSETDAFFVGTGAYHLFNTCNVWSGRNLQRAGIRTGWWTPFAFSLFDSLPEKVEK